MIMGDMNMRNNKTLGIIMTIILAATASWITVTVWAIAKIAITFIPH